MPRRAAAIAIALILQPFHAFASAPMSADDCVGVALGGSGQIAEARGRVEEWRGRLDEVSSVFLPKLNGFGFVAPMFRTHGGSQGEVSRDYGEWGPYFHVEALLSQPIYTFGRVAAGERAASERVEVEEAAVLRVRNAVALETRRYYYLHLFAKSLRPTLASARRTLDEAERVAQDEYDRATGKVTKVDLMRLAYGSSELSKFAVQAEIGEVLALSALKHVMGRADDSPLVLVDETLPPPLPVPLPALEKLLAQASRHRPEWAQITHGRTAATALEKSERLANAPLVFAAANFRADTTPMREDVQNPFYLDQYNDLAAGVAVGLKFDLDPGKASARASQAAALSAQVEGLALFAATGIPLEVRKAHADATQAEAMLRYSTAGSAAARKWFVFAGAALVSGTGDAKDLLEGLVASLQARKGELESLRDVHLTRAQLLFAVGLTGIDGPQLGEPAVPAGSP